MDKMRVSMVGVGGFGGCRRQQMRETGLFQLVAAYDVNQAALVQCLAEDGAAPVGGYNELLAIPGVEAMVISSGAKFHAEQIIQAAERGLHVFVEKPLCSTPGEVEALIAVQNKTGVVIGLGHADHRHDAVSLRIKELIDSGELGQIATFEKTTAHSGGLQIKPGDWRGDPTKNPGGMLFQCGVHSLHELMFYFGPISEVSAIMRSDLHTTQTADVAICHLKFASGLIGSLNAYHVTPYCHTLKLFGTKANLYRDDRYFDEGINLQIQRAGIPNAKEDKVSVTIDPTLTQDGGGLRSFYDAVRKGGECYPSLIDGARAVSVVFAAEESARCGRPVKVYDGQRWV